MWTATTIMSVKVSNSMILSIHQLIQFEQQQCKLTDAQQLQQLARLSCLSGDGTRTALSTTNDKDCKKTCDNQCCRHKVRESSAQRLAGRPAQRQYIRSEQPGQHLLTSGTSVCHGSVHHAVCGCSTTLPAVAAGWALLHILFATSSTTCHFLSAAASALDCQL